MKKFFIPILVFLSFGSFNHVVAQNMSDMDQRNPNLNNSG